MTRARILADYVSSGDELALKAPLLSPALVTPNLGTPSAGVVTNLSGVLPVGVTGGSGLTALGTVTAGNLSNSAIIHGTGSVLQMFNVISVAQTSFVSTNAIILTKTFNRKKGNSHFIANTIVSMAPIENVANTDSADPQLKWFVNGSGVDTNGSITNDGFYWSEVPNWRNDVSSNGRYDIYQIAITQDFTHISSGSDNDSVTIAVDLTGGSDGLYINRGQAGAENGGASSLTIWEVSA